MLTTLTELSQLSNSNYRTTTLKLLNEKRSTNTLTLVSPYFTTRVRNAYHYVLTNMLGRALHSRK